MARPKRERKVKLPAGVDETFVSEIDSMDTDSLKSKIVSLQAGLEENNEFKLSEGYRDAKDSWEMVSGPVRDTAKAIRNKTKLVIEKLKERGAL